MDPLKKVQDIFSVTPNKPTPQEMEPVVLELNNTVIHSMQELREHFHAEDLLKALLNENLYIWLEQHYYEKEAEQIFHLHIEDKNCPKDLCRILGINYMNVSKMSDEDIEKLNARKALIAQFTSDENILNAPWSVALNQEELSSLINSSEKHIYLCKETFSIPIRVSGITYIVIGDAKLESPYTLAQYNNAGITITGISLPETADNVTSTIAKEAAKANGYDDFSETHCPLATAVHNALKSRQMTDIYRLPYTASSALKQYTSKSECKEKIESLVSKAYEAAENRFDTYGSKSIAKQAATFYSEVINQVMLPIKDNLKRIAIMTNKSDVYNSLEQLINKNHKNLQELFCKELTASYNYYKMYDKSYFIDKVDIITYDSRIEEKGFWRLLETAMSDRVKYSIDATSMYSSISELQRDVDDRSATFFKAIYYEYAGYIEQIESLIEMIGNGFPKPEEKESLLQYTERLCAIKAAS